MNESITTILFAFGALNGALGSLVLWRGQKSLYRFFFAGISFTVAVWSLLLAVFYIDITGENFKEYILFFIHFSAFLSVASFALFSSVFPKLKKSLFKVALTVTSLLTAGAFYSIFIKKSVVSLVASDNLLYELGPDYLHYSLFMGLSFILGFWLLYRQYVGAKDQEKPQIKVIFFGTLITVVLAIVTNLLLPAYDSFDLTWTGPIFTVFLVGATFYSAVKHQLFQMELILTELFALVLVVLLTGDLFQVDGSTAIASRAIVLALAVALSYFLVRSVRREILQREKSEKLSVKLVDLNKDLHKLDEMKTEFLSLASHQLRTPLTSIKGYSSMILEGSFGRVPNKIHEPVKRIFESSSILAKIITDLLDVSKIEQGGLQYEMITFSMASMVQSVVDEQQISAKDKNISLLYILKQPGRYALKGDQVKLRQVLVNLVDNAIKYTDKGGEVRVSLHKRKRKDQKFIELRVEDNGRGISKETIGKLFKKFSRGGAGKKTNTSGSGLGLYLAKQIVKAHVGDLRVESEGEGKGSQFIVEFPQEY